MYSEKRLEIIYGGVSLIKKDEFHVTMVNANYINFLINGNKDFQKDSVWGKVVDIFRQFVEEYDLENISRTGKYYFMEKDTRKSIVEEVEVGNIEILFERLSTTLGVSIPVQPTHVTVWTWGDKRGLEINSKDELQSGKIIKI